MHISFLRISKGSQVKNSTEVKHPYSKYNWKAVRPHNWFLERYGSWAITQAPEQNPSPSPSKDTTSLLWPSFILQAHQFLLFHTSQMPTLNTEARTKIWMGRMEIILHLPNSPNKDLQNPPLRLHPDQTAMMNFQTLPYPISTPNFQKAAKGKGSIRSRVAVLEKESVGQGSRVEEAALIARQAKDEWNKQEISQLRGSG